MSNEASNTQRPEGRYRWGVWYTDGEMAFGWLAYEGKHGRPYTIKVDSKEEAEEIAKTNEEIDRDGCVFMALSFDTKGKEFDDAVAALRERARARQRARWA